MNLSATIRAALDRALRWALSVFGLSRRERVIYLDDRRGRWAAQRAYYDPDDGPCPYCCERVNLYEAHDDRHAPACEYVIGNTDQNKGA